MAFDVKFNEGNASFKTAFDKYVAGSGGGGGGSSKYAQPEWGAEAPIEILPEATYEIDPEQGMAYILTPFNLEAGQRYVVDLSGLMEFECTAVEISDGDTTMTAIGNTGALLGGVQTNAPFVIVQAPEEMAAEGVYGMLAWLGGTTSVTLSVTKHGIYKIPAEYLDESKRAPLIVNIIDPDASELECDVDFYTVLAAAQSGRNVVLRDNGAWESVYNLVSANTHSIVFSDVQLTAGYEGVILTFYTLTGGTGVLKRETRLTLT